jgi:hypothetical protein
MLRLEKGIYILLFLCIGFEFFLVLEQIWFALVKWDFNSMSWRLACISGAMVGAVIGNIALNSKAGYIGTSISLIIASEIARRNWIFYDWENAWISVMILTPSFALLSIVAMAIDTIIFHE